MWKILLLGSIFTSDTQRGYFFLFGVFSFYFLLRFSWLQVTEIHVKLIYVLEKCTGRSHKERLTIHTMEGKGWRNGCQKSSAALSMSVCLFTCVSPLFFLFLSLSLSFSLPPFFSLSLLLFNVYYHYSFPTAYRLPPVRKYRHQPHLSYISLSSSRLGKSRGKPYESQGIDQTCNLKLITCG